MSALLVVIIWGTTFVSTKVLLFEGLSPEDILFYRFILAYAGIWVLGEFRLFAASIKDELLFLLLGFLGGSLYFFTENFALKITLASNVALIVCTTPLLTAILSHFLLKNERLNRNLIQGSLMALAGVALVVFNGSFMLKISPLGDFLCIVAAFSWSCYTLLMKRISERYSILFITRKVFFYGLLTICPLFLMRPLTMDVSILSRPVVWINLLYLGLVASLVCYFLWNLTLKNLGAVRTSNYIYLVPLVTLITSSTVIDEKITLIALAGAILILSGVILAERHKNRTLE